MGLKECLHEVILDLYRADIISLKKKDKLILELNSPFSLTKVEDVIHEVGDGGGVMISDGLEQGEESKADEVVSKSICGVGGYGKRVKRTKR